MGYGSNHFSRDPAYRPPKHSLHATRTRAGQKAGTIMIIVIMTKVEWEIRFRGQSALEDYLKTFKAKFCRVIVLFPLIKTLSKLGRIRSCNYPA